MGQALSELSAATHYVKDCSLSWERTWIGEDMQYCVFTEEGMLAITDSWQGNVVLMDRKGNTMLNSVDCGVKLQNPLGIAYHYREQTLLVCDNDAGCVVVLEPTTLNEEKRIICQGIKKPLAVAVMSNGNIVVSSKKQHSGSAADSQVSIYRAL